MSSLGRRPRIAAALVAALALVVAPLLMTAPVQAEVDCTPTLHVQGQDYDNDGRVDLVLDGSWPKYYDLDGSEVFDPCRPDDG